MIKFYVCKCKKTPKISFDNFSQFQSSCGCGKKLYTLEKGFNELFFNKYDLDLNDDISSDYKCAKHNNDIFICFCEECRFDLCNNCLSHHKSEHSTKLKSFDKLQQEILDNINFILECFKPKKSNSPKDSKDIIIKEFDITENPEKKNIKDLISVLIIEYIVSPNNTIIDNIKNFTLFIKNTKPAEKKNSDINTRIAVGFEEEYIKNKNNVNSINKIIISEANFNIDLLKDVPKNLEKLDLSKNMIANIKVLDEKQFMVLEHLNLSMNRLSDDSIKIIKNLNCPNLVSLNLSSNKFTDYDIFEAIEHFLRLVVLNLNSNHFIFRKKDEKKNK